MNSVTVVDDTLYVPRVTWVTDEMRTAAQAKGKPIPPHVRYLFVKQHGKKILKRTPTTITFEGRHLDIAIKRAKRWIRKCTDQKPSHHIALAMAAFHQVDPEGFKQYLHTNAYGIHGTQVNDV